jgi:hypothetical protein
MKKIVLLAIIGYVMAGIFGSMSVFAQSFTVQSVSGRVELEKGGNRVAIKGGETLTAETVIHTGIGASLVLKDGDKTVTVGAARSGKVAELAVSGGVRITGNVATTNTDTVNRSSTSLSTGSARASDAAAGEDIAAE